MRKAKFRLWVCVCDFCKTWSVTPRAWDNQHINSHQTLQYQDFTQYKSQAHPYPCREMCLPKIRYEARKQVQTETDIQK